MPLVFDAATELLRTGTTDPATWTHTPVDLPRAIALFIGQRLSTTDHVVTVTYGGVAMQRKVRATDSAGKPGSAEWWFLGAGIPTGPQTVTVDLDSATTDDMYFVSASFTAEGDADVVDTDFINDNIFNPSVTLQYGGRDSLGVCGIFSGETVATNLTDLGSQTRMHDEWVSIASGWVVSRQTTSAPSDTTLGYTVSTTDVAFAAMAFTVIATLGAPKRVRLPAQARLT